MMMLLWMRVAEAACPATREAVETDVRDADVAFSSLDETAFAAAMDRLDQDLGCLDEALTPGVAAAAHRAYSFEAFLAGEQMRVDAHLLAVLEAEPRYVLPENLVPAQHPLRDALARASARQSQPGAQVPRPDLVLVDGASRDTVPADRPYVLQRLEGGSVQSTQLCMAGEAPPSWVTAPVELPVEAPVARSGVKVPLLVVAAGSAGLAGVSYWMASTREDEFFDPATATGELDRLRTQTNTYASIAVGLGAVAVGTGTAAVLTASR